MSLSALDIHATVPAHVVEGHDYQPPPSGSVRCPCPFVNTLANHGYINRSGKYITLWAATKGIMECYNFEFPLALLLATAGAYTGVAVGWNPAWFNLDQLSWHSTISVEHDRSLSRADLSEGDNTTPSEKHINKMVTYASSPDGLSPQDFAAYRVFLEHDIPHANLPGGIADALRCGEIGLIMGGLGRGDFETAKRRINTEWIKSFFGKGKLPDDWARQQRSVGLDQVRSVTAAVQARMKEIREADEQKKKTV